MTHVKVNQELLERQEYQVFFQDFENTLAELTEALKTTQDVQLLATEISEKGFWGNAFGGISGRNDKDLAGMIENLGASLEVTQSILSIVLKVQNVKNGFLKEFHQALVEKITHLSDDDMTLDANQKNATLAIITKLEQQVSYQLAQSEQVESHDRKLKELGDFVEVKDIIDNEQSEKIAHLDKTAKQIIQGADTRQQLIDELQSKSEAKLKKDRSQDEDINELSILTQSLQQDNQVKTVKDASQDSAIELLGQQKASLLQMQQETSQQLQIQADLIAALEEKTKGLKQGLSVSDKQIEELSCQLSKAEGLLDRFRQEQADYLHDQASLKAQILRNLLPICALLTSGLAIYLSLQPL